MQTFHFYPVKMLRKAPPHAFLSNGKEKVQTCIETTFIPRISGYMSPQRTIAHQSLCWSRRWK